ncbi:MAG TPA: response regulator transcription factor [Opitutaceae bacterium]|nr:response regulator transcription factor [Opitutaceae bacterium]
MSPEHEASGGATILVVDDVPANLGVLLEFLGHAGFKVLVAESGRGALEQLAYSKPDVVLLDVIMPDLDGLAVCRRLKQDAATRDIPVIFMTALTETVDKVAGFAAGGVDYVTKPVQPEEVLARVRAHIEIRRLQQELEEKNRALAGELAWRAEAEDQLQQSLDQAVIMARRDNTIQFCTKLAWNLVERYFGPKVLTALPVPLAEWVARADRKSPFVCERPGSRLAVRIFSGGGDDTPVMLLLDEKVDLASPEPLQKLGLTPREAEVLFWLTQGKTSPEIGIILGTALNTVKKHVQNVFQKLGVENRTAAAVRALEVLGKP